VRPVRGESGWAVSARIVDRSQGSVVTSRVPVTFTRRHLKVVLPEHANGKADLLHDRQTGNCRLVRHDRKNYVQINTKAVSAVGDAARTVQGAIRKGVGKITGKAPPAKTTLRIEASTQTQMVGGMPCRLYKVYYGRARVQDIWATSWQHAGIGRSDMDALRDLARAMNQPALTTLLGLVTDGRYSLTESVLKIDGYPVIFVQYDKGKPICQIRMDKPNRTTVQSDTFRCPASYRLYVPGMR